MTKRICYHCKAELYYDEASRSHMDCSCGRRNNFTGTPADVPMPDVVGDPSPLPTLSDEDMQELLDNIPDFKMKKNPDYFIQKDKALILFDLVTGICIPEEGWNSDMTVYTKQLKYRLDGDEYLKFLGEYTMWRQSK